MNTEDYRGKMNELFNEPTYKVLQKEPTNRVETKTAALIRKLDITEDAAKKLITNASVPPRLNGFPKIRKENFPLEPIANCIDSPTYLLAQHLARFVGPLLGLTE
jgi:hypothetical protein